MSLVTAPSTTSTSFFFLKTIIIAHLYCCQSFPFQFFGTPSLVYFNGSVILDHLRAVESP
ncbi:hypothetical protein PF003_g24096 [Phytophthora fragariae]|nr:hypothetical protein PF003_g24096 [Phytophthora fragariae]